MQPIRLGPPPALLGRCGAPLLPAHRPHEREFVGSVRGTLSTLSSYAGAPRLAAAADAAGMSVRSFQRRLESAGLRFGELVQQSRFEAACRMLCEPGRKVVQVSAALGYTDSANFTRAFRRWAGVPPREFQRRAFVARERGR